MMRISRNEQGSLPLAMLLTLVGVGLTGLIGTTVLGQVTTSRYDGDRGAAMDAAQSGIETGLAQMRGLPTDTNGDAKLTDLPCATTSASSPDMTIAGTVSAAGRSSFAVNVYYVSQAPPSTTDAEVWAKANRIGCIAAGPAIAPMYALLASTGTAGAESRTVTATYLFQSHTKPNVPGGTIKIYNSDQCLAAPHLPTDAIPLTAGTQAILQTCAATDPKQIFTYNPTLQVELKATEGSTNFPHGACLQGMNTNVGNAGNGSPVYFADCSTTMVGSHVAVLDQVWSLNNRDNFEGTLNGTTNDGRCFNVDWTKTPPVVVINNVGTNGKVLNTAGDGTDGTPCSGTSGDYTKYKTFFPDPSAGTGAAGPATRQLVNYDEFGRCLDVTGNSVGTAFLVVFPCKQTPDPNGIQWNQVWFLPTVASGQTAGTGWLTLKDSGGNNYCLTSPGTITTAGSYPRIYACTPTGTPPANQTWTRRIFTGVNQTSYRIESTYGTSASAPWCLLPSPTDYWDQFTAMKISKLVLAPCDGSNLQKWNASPSILTSVVSDYRER
jgi:hypothetical protein